MAASKMICLGLIGYSEGNGHPYSWSAICNGYSPVNMLNCGYPTINDYLSKETWPTAKLPNVKVTHIWTQEHKISEQISLASLIPNIALRPEDMIGQIDAVLLARDDAENHFEFAKPFLKAGVPIYIDKPIALSLDSLETLYAEEKYNGQIFTCSALRYATELKLTAACKDQIGKIKHIEALTPKSWNKYATHIIEPVLNMIRTDFEINYDEVLVSKISEDGKSVSLCLNKDQTLRFTAFGNTTVSPISINVYGEKGWKNLVFKNSFSAFRSALADFIQGVQTRTIKSPYQFNRKVISILELGVNN